jgi:hypothetical protein
MRPGWSGGLVKELETHLETIGTQAEFFYLFLFIGTCIKAYKKQKKNTLNNVFIIFYCLLSYKIDKYGEVVAEPI